MEQKIWTFQLYHPIFCYFIFVNKFIQKQNKKKYLVILERAEKIKKVKKNISEKVIKNIRCKSSQIVACSARDGEISELMDIFEKFEKFPDRAELEKRDFLMSVDHCFQVKGSGTVFTGTILAGQIKIGDTVEVSVVM